MARMGQCFSSTEESVQVPLLSNSVREVPDILGGKHPVTDEHYIFSDGIGMISPGLLKEPAATVSCQAPYLSGRKAQACSRHGAFATWVRLPVLGVTDDTRGGGEVPPRGHQDGHVDIDTSDGGYNELRVSISDNIPPDESIIDNIESCIVSLLGTTGGSLRRDSWSLQMRQQVIQGAKDEA
ncbi:hypothetical protein V5799_014022 [Amblyomma americanum]|uniref:RNA-dependent RNA polymerase n=1 Tax=Amblyomma americanum TaxID=6943 RepID=A0AAQ4E491_AMBAM